LNISKTLKVASKALGSSQKCINIPFITFSTMPPSHLKLAYASLLINYGHVSMIRRFQNLLQPQKATRVEDTQQKEYVCGDGYYHHGSGSWIFDHANMHTMVHKHT
jgi:hypothetical protein